MADYDWPYIRQRYESGETAYSLSKRLGGHPSKQAIMKRAAKEGWEQHRVTDSGPQRLPIVARALTINAHKLTDELLETVLGMIAIGASEQMACQASGITQRTWTRWKSEDSRLQDAVNRARAGKLSEWIGRIDRASETDWKAAQALLQAQPETKEHFGKGGEGGRVEIVIHIEREGESVRTNARPVIEHDTQAA